MPGYYTASCGEYERQSLAWLGLKRLLTARYAHVAPNVSRNPFLISFRYANMEIHLLICVFTISHIKVAEGDAVSQVLEVKPASSSTWQKYLE